MVNKIKPCLTESRRHTWEHVGNKTVRRETMRSIELSRKGVYRCITCAAVKYGDARTQI